MSADPAITPELVEEHGITPEEFGRIKDILGREPNYTELGIFSVMWSEHCSYKNTRPLLKGFPTQSPRVLVGAGEENAGILDIGDGLAVSFKIESHNHPSAVEPFQGAATGVGGIIRDIFTMGARPVCAVNSLRFGGLDNPDVRRLFEGVVSGIAHYGNCFGIPTVAGEVYFDKSYEGNPLVNAFALGVLRHDQIARGAATGAGNPVFYVGPATGRDGLAGAAFASQDLTEESAEQQRGAVQVGDPFMEKLCVEACLELLATGAVAGIQDMGAAGLTCSTCETAARGGTGIEIDLAKVPQRSPGMTPYEILLSESQERMLIIVKQGREEEVKRIFDKWDLPWAEIGHVTDTGRMVVKNSGSVVADLPASQLADDAPIYHREAKEPAYLEGVRDFTLDGIDDLDDPAKALERLLAWPSIASKNWVYRQYDHMVRNNTMVNPGSDAAVIRVKGDSLPGGDDRNGDFPEKILAISVDCNAGQVYLDPFEGAKAAVAECARNLACSGAVPLGTTDNLNFGNPHNPELFWQLKEAVRGLAAGCEVFNAPVTGGNVSLYNQNPEGAIDPTPTVAMVGLIEDAAYVTTQWFKDEGDAIILLGAPVAEDALQGLGGSAFLQVMHDEKNGLPPRCDLEAERTLGTTLVGLIQSGLVKSAHDCAEGGLAVALAEGCISNYTGRNTSTLVGADVNLTTSAGAAISHPCLDGNGDLCGGAVSSPDELSREPRLDALLFGEANGRVVISTAELDAVKAVERARLLGVPAVRIGTVGGDALKIKTPAGEHTWGLSGLHDLWWNSIANAMG
ncbi:MAG: phosphoribosylformylglycinamidine synthase subunit PurL [Verrucomicrobiota bacterium]|nr:phosphoribosylformylglycinamidine synthase subunit PurL [Verrucomicrobiota bacterium]